MFVVTIVFFFLGDSVNVGILLFFGDNIWVYSTAVINAIIFQIMATTKL